MPEWSRNDKFIRRMKPSHDIVKRLYLAGYRNYQIAKATGYADNSVSRIINAPIVQLETLTDRNKINEKFIEKQSDTNYLAQARGIIEKSMEQAANYLVDSLSIEEVPHSVKQKSAIEILHMGGLKPKEELDLNQNINMDEGTRSAIHEALAARRRMRELDDGRDDL